MKKNQALILSLAFVSLVSLVTFFFWPSSDQNNKQQIIDETLSNPTETDPISVALKVLELSQGEKGFELWRLKSDFASIQQESGLIKLNLVNIIYYLKPDNAELHVTGKQGEINQAENMIYLNEDIIVTKEENTLLSSKLSYNGTTHLIDFPEKIYLENISLNGSANTANWDLNNNFITATGNVLVTLYSNAQKEQKRQDTQNNNQEQKSIADLPLAPEVKTDNPTQ